LTQKAFSAQADPSYSIEGVLGVGGEFRKGSSTAYDNPSNTEPCYSPVRKRHLFLSFPYVCPEPVLAK
jgi:hypothetical protein